jgi:hypothetical protein
VDPVNLKLLNPRLLIFVAILTSTLIWVFYKPLFSFEKYVSLTGILNYCLFFILILTAAFIAEKTRLTPKKAMNIEQFKLEKKNQGQTIFKEAMILASIAMAAQLLWISRMVMQQGLGPLIQLVLIEPNWVFSLRACMQCMFSL